MAAQDLLDQLELLVRSRYGLVVVETLEEERVEDLFKQIASKLHLHYYSWTRSRGLRRGMNVTDPYVDDKTGQPATEPADALRLVEREGSGIYHFAGLAAWFGDPLIERYVRDVATQFAQRSGALVVSGHENVRLPDSLRSHATIVRLPPLRFEDYRALVERIIREHSARMQVKVELTPPERVRLIQNLSGLSLVEAEKVLNQLIIDDGFLRADDVVRALEAKRKMVQQDGLLEYWPAEQGMAEVAGLAGLKAWLAKRRNIVADPLRAAEFGLSFPKGALLLGVPGCGKSLCAKAVANEWGLPLLKLDPANLYDKYVGDSEKNFKRAMQTAERLAPIVLWIDELEKAFAGGSGEEDGGVSRRVFGAFLSWLQERRGDVFVVATSNDVTKLPPEFIRKGRFDEVFFVDLPRADARRAIFTIHLRKRRQDPAAFDLTRLAAAAEGFSGAEMEQAIVSGLYTAFSQGTPLSTEILLAEIASTRPLSRTMQERLDDLRRWAAARTVSAD
ncbi:MAG TPA: AAA family ATPase [Gemmatimonadaceae bacterium]